MFWIQLLSCSNAINYVVTTSSCPAGLVKLGFGSASFNFL